MTAPKILQLDHERQFLPQYVCPSCKSKDFSFFLQLQNARQLRFTFHILHIADSPPAWRILNKCNSCQLVFKGSIPRTDFLASLYCNDQENVLWKFHSSKRKTHNKLHVVNNLLSSLTHSPSILDVGCHDGSFLKMLPPRCDKFGLDPSPQRNYPGEVKYIEGLVEIAQEKWFHYFDIVTLFDAFEHFHDVDQAFINISRYLKVGGYLVLETGNSACLESKFFRSHWWYYSIFDHNVFGSPEHFKISLPKYGLEIVTIQKTAHSIPQNRFRYYLRDIPLSMSPLLLTVFGRFPTLYSKLLEVCSRSGTLPILYNKNHCMVVARKIEI